MIRAPGSQVVVPTLDSIYATAIGVKAEPFKLAGATASAAPTTQTVWGTLLALNAGTVATGIKMRIGGTAASGTNPTTARFGLADSTGKILVLSGNVNTAANWAIGTMAFPFTAPYTVPTDGVYFACFVVNGTWVTTQPTPNHAAPGNGSDVTKADGSNIPIAFSWTGQTDLPAVGSSVTLTTGTNRVYYLPIY